MLICIACKTSISKDGTITRDLTQTPSIIGYPPDDILECARDAISFWMYQMQQQDYIKKSMLDKAQSDAHKSNQELKIYKMKAKVEKENMKNEIKKLENNLKREKENAYDIGVMLREKTECYKKLLMRRKQKDMSGLSYNGDSEYENVHEYHNY